MPSFTYLDFHFNYFVCVCVCIHARSVCVKGRGQLGVELISFSIMNVGDQTQVVRLGDKG